MFVCDECVCASGCVCVCARVYIFVVCVCVISCMCLCLCGHVFAYHALYPICEHVCVVGSSLMYIHRANMGTHALVCSFVFSRSTLTYEWSEFVCVYECVYVFVCMRVCATASLYLVCVDFDMHCQRPRTSRTHSYDIMSAPSQH